MVRGLLMIVLVVGCGGSVPTPEIVYVTPAPTEVAQATPEPTPTPTPTPTVTPTPTPTPVAAPTPGGAIGYLGFLLRVGQTSEAFVEQFDRLSNAGGDEDRLRPLVDEMLEQARSEQRWLASYPPDACYRSAHGRWDRVMNQYERGLDKMRYGLLRPVTWDDILEGLAIMSAATVEMSGMSDEIANAACSP